MTKSGKPVLLLYVFLLTLALVGSTRAQSIEDISTFLDSEIPGIHVQVNATAQVRPTENLTVTCHLDSQTSVHVEHFNLEVVGFLNGTFKTSLANMTDADFSLSKISRESNLSVTVPQEVWGITFGEIDITYTATFEGLELRFPHITSGFPMTYVENTIMSSLEYQVNSLNQSYSQLMNLHLNLTDSFTQLNRTYWDLHYNYTVVQAGLGELDNTRRLTTVLGITTIFFVATTLYMVFRRPRDYW